MAKKLRRIRIPFRIIVSVVLFLLQLGFMFTVIYNITAKSAAAYFITLAAGIITVILILNKRGNPNHKIAWIIFILVVPIFGISVYLLWGGGRVLPHLRHRMEKCEAKYFPFLKQEESVTNRLRYYDMIHSRQADYLSGETGYPLYGHTSTEYLAPGEIFFPRFLEELARAEKYIYIEFFILAEGDMWNEIHKILKSKVESGVEVKIIFDDFGSIKRQHKNFISTLKDEGIEISVFNPIGPSINVFTNNRNHRKIVVIDGKIAVTGGINIGDEYINRMKRFGNWMDSAVIIKGDAVKSFLVMFCCMWEFTTRKPINIESHIVNFPVDDEGFVLPYADDPLDNKNPAEGIYMQILNTAQRYVYIASPYLIIDNTMTNILRMAAKSGIDVRIITPYIPDKWYVHPVTQYNYLQLLEAGIKIYEYTPGFIHSKLFVSDDKIATVGTVNMDYRSFIFHFECGAWICDNSTVLDIKDHFDKLIDESKEIILAEWKKRPILQKLKQSILHLFAPFM